MATSTDKFTLRNKRPRMMNRREAFDEMHIRWDVFIACNLFEA
jgi:hypothetical protein